MNAVVIYESLTGNTRRAGEVIAERLRRSGVPARAMPITGVDYQALTDADLVVVGSWTDGLFFIGQRPGRQGRLRTKLPYVQGKRCAVYCTYAIDPGRTLDKLVALVEARGADVIGGMAIKRDRIEPDSADFVERLLAALAESPAR